MSVKRVLEGLALVAVGAILLANTLGLLSWGVWWNIASLWPLLLVAAGLDVIGKGLGTEWVRAVASLLIIGGLLVGALVMTPGGSWPTLPFITVERASGVEPFSLVRGHDPSIEEGSVSVRGGAGSLAIRAGSDLARVSGSAVAEPRFDVTSEGSRARIDIAPPERPVWVWPGRVAAFDCVIALDRSVVWDVTVDAGVSEFDVDLRGLPTRTLRLKAGVSDGVVRLGRMGRGVPGGGDVRIEAGVSRLTVEVERGATVLLRTKTGIADVDLPGPFMSRGTDDGFARYELRGEPDGLVWEVELEGGVSDVTFTIVEGSET